MIKNGISILLIIFLLVSCNKKETFNFQGKWQSLNEPEFVIEIDENDHYTLYRDKESFLTDIADFEQLKIKIKETAPQWNTFTIEDEKSQKEFVKGRIEIVNQDRIRIYFHKHHEILDLADEFHRTEDLTSYHEILGNLMKMPEK